MQSIYTLFMSAGYPLARMVIWVNCAGLHGQPSDRSAYDTRDEAWRIAANIAKLTDVLQRPTGVTNEAMLANCERAEMQALLHDYLEAGKQMTAADVIAKAQAVLSESELLRAAGALWTCSSRLPSGSLG